MRSGAPVPRASGCKGCGDAYRVTDEQVARVLASPMFAADLCVPDEVYRERLALCAACPRLMDGKTCTVCGCIIPVAAKLKVRECPLPGGGRWAALA